VSVLFRVFFFDDEDRLSRVPLKRFERLMLRHDSSETFPELAGRRVRYAFVALKGEQGKPVKVEHVDYAIIQFDDEGRLDEAEHMRAMQLAVETVSSPSRNSGGPVINARRQFSKKQYDHEFRWRPSPEVEGAIVRAIFGSKERPLKLV